VDVALVELSRRADPAEARRRRGPGAAGKDGGEGKTSTPTWSALEGTKKTLVPTAAAPAYFLSALTPAVEVSMVENVWAVATSARPRIAPSNIAP